MGRGPLLDTAALLAEKGRVRAALDVTDPEPLPADHPLWDAPGVYITPHVAGGAQTFYRALAGSSTPSCVDGPKGPHWRTSCSGSSGPAWHQRTGDGPKEVRNRCRPGKTGFMRIAVVSDGEGGGRLREVDGRAGERPKRGSLWRVSDLAGAIADLEGYTDPPPRWIWGAADELYPALIEHSLRVARCHDIVLVESLLLGYHGRFGEPSSLGAAWARLHGREVPPDLGYQVAAGAEPQPALFEPDRSTLPADVDRLEALIEVYDDQQRRIVELPHPDRFALLAAVESAGALAAAEMAHDGVPWRADVHDAVLTEHLGPRPSSGERPPVLADLAQRISETFGRTVNPDSPTQLMKAFAAIGHPVSSTRSWVLRQVDHPVVPLLLRYKELSRLHSTHGWTWVENWVRHGRFRPDYVVGGVVSADGPPAAAGRCRFPRWCAERWSRTPTGPWSAPTPASSNRASSPRSPVTTRWPKPRTAPICTLGWPTPSAATGSAPRSR